MATIPTNYRHYAKNSHHIDFQRTKYNNERTLYNKVLAEGFNHYGVPMTFFVVSYDTAHDKIFGEDNNRRAERKFEVMSYYELPREEDIFTKYGIEGIDLFHMYVSKEHFRVSSTTGYITAGGSFSTAFSNAFNTISVVSEETENAILIYDAYPQYYPKAGDIIRAKYNNYYYEIITVKDEEQMFLQAKHSWDFIVRPYKDAHWSVSPIISGDDLTNYTDATDIFSISGAIDQEKTNVLYQKPQSEQASQDPLGGW